MIGRVDVDRTSLHLIELRCRRSEFGLHASALQGVSSDLDAEDVVVLTWSGADEPLVDVSTLDSAGFLIR